MSDLNCFANYATASDLTLTGRCLFTCSLEASQSVYFSKTFVRASRKSSLEKGTRFSPASSQRLNTNRKVPWVPSADDLRSAMCNRWREIIHLHHLTSGSRTHDCTSNKPPTGKWQIPIFNKYISLYHLISSTDHWVLLSFEKVTSRNYFSSSFKTMLVISWYSSRSSASAGACPSSWDCWITESLFKPSKLPKKKRQQQFHPELTDQSSDVSMLFARPQPKVAPVQRNLKPSIIKNHPLTAPYVFVKHKSTYLSSKKKSATPGSWGLVSSTTRQCAKPRRSNGFFRPFNDL